MSATQTLLLQVWPVPQSAAMVQLLVHWPSRHTRPAPQCLLIWQVFPPPQSLEQVPHCPSTHIPPEQVDAEVQGLGFGCPGTQAPRLSQTKLPRLAQSSSLVQVPLGAHCPFWQ